MQVSRFCLTAVLIAAASPALAHADIGMGQEIYQAQCSACHSNQPGVATVNCPIVFVAP